MPYELCRELRDGQLCRLSIGLDAVDDYLDFLRCRCRPNTWLNYAHDLKIFFNTVDKPVTEVSTADVFRFIRCQSQGPADPVGDASSEGVSTRTIKAGGWLGLGARTLIEITATGDTNLLPTSARGDSIRRSRDVVSSQPAEERDVRGVARLAPPAVPDGTGTSENSSVHCELQDIKSLVQDLVRQNRKDQLSDLPVELRMRRGSLL